jgi:hypothetical protein
LPGAGEGIGGGGGGTGGSGGGGGPTIGSGCAPSDWDGLGSVLFYEDFESYGGNDTLFRVNWGGSPSNHLSTDHAMSGVWSLGDGSGDNYYRTAGISPAGTTLVFSMRVYWTGIQQVNAQGAIIFVADTFYHTGFNGQCDLAFLTNGTVRLRSGSPHAIVEDSAAGVLIENQWNCVAGVLTIADAGAYKIYVNGTLVLEGTGDLMGAIFGSTNVSGVQYEIESDYWIDDLWVANAASFGGVTLRT